MENELNFAVDFSVAIVAKATAMQQEACSSSNQEQLKEMDQSSFIELIVSAHAPCK